jgi:hypothetical protein
MHSLPEETTYDEMQHCIQRALAELATIQQRARSTYDTDILRDARNISALLEELDTAIIETVEEAAAAAEEEAADRQAELNEEIAALQREQQAATHAQLYQF